MVKINTELAKSMSRSALKVLESTKETVNGKTNELVDNLTGSIIDARNKKEEKKQEKAQKEQREKEIQSGLFVENGVTIISSVDGMGRWLDSLQGRARPSGLQCLKTQLQIIDAVSTPNSEAMAFDTVLDSLYKALNTAETEGEKQEIRDSFATMIQNYFFFSEAKLYFAIEKDKQDAFVALSQAGKVLARSVSQVALFSIPTLKAVALTSSAVTQAENSFKVNQLFNDEEESSQFFSKVCSWVHEKKKIEEKLKNHHRNLELVFEMFDQYSSLIGKSILIHGMLGKFRSQLVEIYKQQQFEPYLKRMKIKAGKKFLQLFSTTLSDSDFNFFNPIGSAIKIAGCALSSIGTSRTTISSVDSFYLRLDQFKIDYEESLEKEQQLMNEKESMMIQLKEARLRDRKPVKERINLLEQKIQREHKKVNELSETIEDLKMAFPEAIGLRKKIAEYENNLRRIEGKFAVDFSGNI